MAETICFERYFLVLFSSIAHIAQLVEHTTDTREVEGSIPSVRTNAGRLCEAQARRCRAGVARFFNRKILVTTKRLLYYFSCIEVE